ncbi:hypothetical protein GDO78_014618 [Eleutherodactylus coqui]|uniref:Uncharacterized protein n=1 Tax=Eleutherodactylus coqui TaxID=57060 RepID=A0A8J6EEH6_ELECQ|nr:hypothetical protein GDO78_014618 [Eleutherodactylus coqui]
MLLYPSFKTKRAIFSILSFTFRGEAGFNTSVSDIDTENCGAACDSFPDLPINGGPIKNNDGPNGVLTFQYECKASQATV